jgi:aquaporin Z
MALRSTTGPGQAQPAGRTVTIDAAMARKAAAELIGTAILVFFGCGVATVSFGFRAFGSSIAAGILVTGLTFGLILIALVAVIGPISGSHVNPAVTLGAYLTGRMPLVDAVAYWIAQIVGAIIGALLLLWVLHSSPFYSKSRIGLGTNGYDNQSLLHASAGGAFLIEVILTATFVLVVLAATRKEANVPISGLVIGLVLGVANIAGIAVDGASINPARSLGPAIVTGGTPLSQVWVFLIAPLVGAILAAGLHLLFNQVPAGETGGLLGLGRFRTAPPVWRAEDQEGTRPAAAASGQAAPGTSSSPSETAQVSTSSRSAAGSAPGTGAGSEPGGNPGGGVRPEADPPTGESQAGPPDTRGSGGLLARPRLPRA